MPGPCMHEALITDKKQKAFDVSTLDIAKALIEHGYHPMTVYFPLVLPGTMLIEPTETESKDAIDKFADTMIKIAEMAEEEGAAELFHSYPHTTPRKRLDEVRAARKPELKWNDAA